MKHLKLYSFGTLILATFLYAEHAAAISVAVQPPMLHLNSVAGEVPKDDGHEEPDEGYECEQLFPFCEAN
jgi:hypothetical protein